MEECHKMLTDQINWANPEGDQVRIDISRPLPLSGPPGHMKAARYQDFGLELLVPEHMWIDDVYTYDISASYGISQWWFNRQKFYIDRHTADSSRKAVRTHMRILSVVGMKAYSHYGYDYLKEITLRRADYQEYTIAEKDFKNLYPSYFEDLNLLLLQGHLNHLSGLDKRMLSTAVNLWTHNLDATGYEYKHDYTIIESPREVVFPVSKNERKIMRFNEIYKFSDGTLTNILEALDYKVKEYKNRRDQPKDNPLGSVEVLRYDIKRSKSENKGIVPTEMELVLEQTQQGASHEVSVSTEEMEILLEQTSNKLMVDVPIKRTGKLGDSDVYTLEDPTLILEILSRRFFLRLNLPDHRSVQVKMEMEIPRSSGVYFITACSYSTDTSKELMKAQVYVSKLPQL
ncbi:hypothetical protein Tco_1499282 [Tanacetum coccineum]